MRWATRSSAGRRWRPPRRASPPCRPEPRRPGPRASPSPMRVLVTEPLSESGLALLRQDFEVDVRPELSKEGLADAIGPYSGLIVRSQTKVTDDVLDRAEWLKV